MNTATPPPGPFVREHFHPLEIIPYFRRFRRTVARDILYTFLWSCLFGLGFMLVGSASTGRLPGLQAVGLYVLISNLVGFAIHALFSTGTALGLDCAARSRGFMVKVLYFTAVPVLGVMIGFLAASFFVDVGFRGLFTDLTALLSVATTSLVISVVLSVIFFWRERSAMAQAALERERARAEGIERQAALANLRALQAQIEPHFLFNTLANVSSLIDLDPAKAKRMVESFNRFLRASLDGTRREQTTLAGEAELIRSYLEVLQVRMGPRLRFTVAVEPEVASFCIAPMLLQPVVENAIRHGLEPKVEGGDVAFRAWREDGMVRIGIEDTGVGFAPTTRGGVGLANLRDRLRLLHGERATLAIVDRPAGGTCVVVSLPA